MTVRVVPLRSVEAGTPPAAPEVAARLALVAELSAHSWQLTGRPLPTQVRAQMPGVVRPLRGPAVPERAP